jgi:hypothetical protein
LIHYIKEIDEEQEIGMGDIRIIEIWYIWLKVEHEAKFG